MRSLSHVRACWTYYSASARPSPRKGVLGRGAAANDQMLLAEILMIWKKLPQMIKAEKDAQEQIEALNSKIANCKDSHNIIA